MQYQRSHTIQPPLLMVGDNNHDKLRFFNLLRHEFLNLSLPTSLRGHRCCGCLDRWLIMISDSTLQLLLFNRISGTQVSLPTQPKCFLSSKYEEQRICRVTKAILSAPPTDSNCIIAAMVGFNVILLCRPGQAEWTVFEGGLDGAFEDLIFHKGQLFAFASTGKLTIVTFDSLLRGTVVKEVLPSSEMSQWHSRRYLVEIIEPSDCAIFGVIKSYVPPNMRSFVFKLKGDSWVRWQCSCNLSLFVGEVRCEFIRVNGIRSVKTNCVYFTSKLAEHGAPDGLGVYSFYYHSVEPLQITRDSGCSSIFEPVWVKPILF